MAARRPRIPAQRVPLRTYLRQQRRRRRLIAALVIILLAAAVAADRMGIFGQVALGPAEMARYDGRTFTVVRVIDGDTLDVDAPDGEHATTRVRLWGIDTPEMAWPEQGRDEPEPFAEEATAFVRELVEGQAVTLHLEPQRVRGRYGRVIAHVELADGRWLNELLVERGLAEAETRWAHDELDRYLAAERRARLAGRGIWGE